MAHPESDPAQLECAPAQKQITYAQAVELIRSERASGKTVIFAQGVFDILHDGHIRMLREAKSHGDILVVGLENDEGVRKNKGMARPVNPECDRRDVLAELSSVDYAFVFPDALHYADPDDRDAYVRRYAELHPDAVAVSAWDPYIGQIGERAGQAGVAVLPIGALVPGRSTTAIIEKLESG